VLTSESVAIIVPSYGTAVGEYQVANIAAALDAYLSDSDIYDAVNNALSLRASPT
jgi:hypothetical protein